MHLKRSDMKDCVEGSDSVCLARAIKLGEIHRLRLWRMQERSIQYSAQMFSSFIGFMIAYLVFLLSSLFLVFTICFLWRVENLFAFKQKQEVDPTTFRFPSMSLLIAFLPLAVNGEIN